MAWIRDRFWPTLDRPAGKPQSVPERFFPPGVDGATADAVVENIKNEEQLEEERNKATDQKLQVMLQFTAISVTISLGVTTFLAGQTRQDVSKGILTTAICVVAYVSLQFLRAVLAAVEGLERRGFQRLTLEATSWHGDRDLVRYKHRLLRVRAVNLSTNAEEINKKVGCMAVSHAALKNALLAMIIGIFVMTLLAVRQAWMGAGCKIEMCPMNDVKDPPVFHSPRLSRDYSVGTTTFSGEDKIGSQGTGHGD